MNTRLEITLPRMIEHTDQWLKVALSVRPWLAGSPEEVEAVANAAAEQIMAALEIIAKDARFHPEHMASLLAEMRGACVSHFTSGYPGLFYTEGGRTTENPFKISNVGFDDAGKPSDFAVYQWPDLQSTCICGLYFQPGDPKVFEDSYHSVMIGLKGPEGTFHPDGGRDLEAFRPLGIGASGGVIQLPRSGRGKKQPLAWAA